MPWSSQPRTKDLALHHKDETAPAATISGWLGQIADKYRIGYSDNVTWWETSISETNLTLFLAFPEFYQLPISQKCTSMVIINQRHKFADQIRIIRTVELSMDNRKKDRRSYKKIPDFPFLTKEGIALRERRRYIDRRVRNMRMACFKA